MIVKSCILESNNLDLVVDISEQEEILLNTRYKWKIDKCPKSVFYIGENRIKGLFVNKYFAEIEAIIKNASTHMCIIDLMDYVVRI